MFPTITFSVPGNHGVIGLGKHGCGIPKLAATAGLAGDVHIPKGAH